MNEFIGAASAAFSGNGGTDGYFTVVNANPFYTGAYAWISNTDAGSNRRVQITETVNASNKIGVRFVSENDSVAANNAGLPSPSYGRSDISAYTVAKASRIDMEGQVVRIQQPYNEYPTT